MSLRLDREWREASDERRSRVALALIVGTGALLRFWSLGHGIPYGVGVDEPQIMTRVVHMMKTGDLNPHFFDYPTLYIYLQLLLACVRFLVGATGRLWGSLADVSSADFYLWGRMLTATLGTATIPVVYAIGMRWGTRHALLAAGLTAVMPMHVRESHYVLTDVPMTFFVALTFLLSLRAHEKGSAGGFAAAGAVAGLGVATKYNAAFALLLPIVAAWMTLGARPSRLRCVLLSMAGAVGAFLVAAPYSVLDLPAFLDGYARLAQAYRPQGGEAPWLTYLKHLRLQMHWPGFLLLLSGIVLGVVRAARGPGRVRWTLLVAFPVVYFWFVSTRGLVFGRYLLPIVPFVSLLAALAVVSGVSLLRRFEIPRAPRTILITALTVAAVLPPLTSAIAFDRMNSRPSTLDAAFQQVLKDLPPSAVVVVERGIGLTEMPYRVDNVERLDDLTFEEYVARGVDYVIATDANFGTVLDRPSENPGRYEAYMRLFGQSTELGRFEPGNGRVGPRIWVYKIGRP